MKVVKYFVKLTVKDDKGENPVKLKVVKHEKGEQGTKRKVVEVEEHPFRKLVNARKFVNNVVERNSVECTPMKKEGDVWIKECTSTSGAKLTFQIRQQRIVKPKKEKKEEKTSKKEEQPQTKAKQETSEQPSQQQTGNSSGAESTEKQKQ